LKITEQQPICTRPFEWFEVHPDGSTFLCCPSWLRRPVGNLLQQAIEEIWNGQVAREIRKSVLNGSFHNCSAKRCPHLVNKITPVRRGALLTDDKLRCTLNGFTGRAPYLPRQLNLCFDHSCNLSCPSCRKEIQTAKGDDLAQVEQIAAIIEAELLPHATSVTLSGFGDPFGSPTYLKLLHRLNRNEYPLLEQIRLHTNGQLLNEQMWQRMPELQPLVREVEISLDAASAQTYQINRPGGSFDQLLKNLKFLSTKDIRLTLSMVVQENNWREIPQLIELAHRFSAHIYLSQLVNWGTFTKEEFFQRAVHLNGHRDYQQFKELFQKITSVAQGISSNLPFRHSNGTMWCR